MGRGGHPKPTRAGCIALALALALAVVLLIGATYGPLAIREEEDNPNTRRTNSRQPIITQTGANHSVADQPTQPANELPRSRLTETESARSSLECVAIAKVIPTLGRGSSQAFLPAPCAFETQWKPARLGALAAGDAAQPGRPNQPPVLSHQQDRAIPTSKCHDRTGPFIS